MADRSPNVSGSFQVRPYRPWRTALVIAVSTVAVVVGVLFAYELGLRHGGYEKYQARAVEAHLRMQVADLRERVADLSEARTRLERSRRIDRATLERLERMLEERVQVAGRLEEELTFYQSLVSPAEADPGINVERFSLMRDGEDGRYAFEIVLTRLNRDDSYVSGHVDLTLDAVRGRERVALDLADVEITGDEESSALEFRFKYFQRLEGAVRLPDELEPVQLEMRVRPAEDGHESVENVYTWSSLVSGGT